MWIQAVVLLDGFYDSIGGFLIGVGREFPFVLVLELEARDWRIIDKDELVWDSGWDDISGYVVFA